VAETGEAVLSLHAAAEVVEEASYRQEVGEVAASYHQVAGEAASCRRAYHILAEEAEAKCRSR
jgi:hypothetical protein